MYKDFNKVFKILDKLKAGNNVKMLGIYFSGTGNSRYALEVFLRKYDETAEILALEDERVVSYIESNEEIVFAYSVQYSILLL